MPHPFIPANVHARATECLLEIIEAIETRPLTDPPVVSPEQLDTLRLVASALKKATLTSNAGRRREPQTLYACMATYEPPLFKTKGGSTNSAYPQSTSSTDLAKAFSNHPLLRPPGVNISYDPRHLEPALDALDDAIKPEAFDPPVDDQDVEILGAFIKVYQAAAYIVERAELHYELDKSGYARGHIAELCNMLLAAKSMYKDGRAPGADVNGEVVMADLAMWGRPKEENVKGVTDWWLRRGQQTLAILEWKPLDVLPSSHLAHVPDEAERFALRRRRPDSLRFWISDANGSHRVETNSTRLAGDLVGGSINVLKALLQVSPVSFHFAEVFRRAPPTASNLVLSRCSSPPISTRPPLSSYTMAKTLSLCAWSQPMSSRLDGSFDSMPAAKGTSLLHLCPS
jgi:hypothetical protein